MIIIDFCAIFGFLIQSYSLKIEYLLMGRLIVGVVIGISLGIIPIYLLSISPLKMSGIVGSMNQLFITIGIAVGYGMSFIL